MADFDKLSDTKYLYACTFSKFFNNGSAQVNYSPTNFDKFPIKIVPKQHGLTHVELVGLLKNLKTVGNPKMAEVHN